LRIINSEGEDEEFGEARLIEELRAGLGQSAETVAGRVLERVQAFSSGDQSDDLTLVVIRGMGD
jgi:serine phosphatase RsbU (regulator of sigma subunit)